MMNKEKVYTVLFSDFLELTKNKENQNVQDFGKPSTELVFELHRKLESFLCSKVDDRYLETLFDLHQFGNSVWKSFVIQFLPSLISLYLFLAGRKQQLDTSKLDAVFLSIYNTECSRNLEAPFLRSFRIPSLSNASVYHQPSNISSPMLTECILSRHEQSNKAIQVTEPRNLSNSMSCHIRSDVFKTALRVYNRKIASMSDVSQLSFCKMVVRYATINLRPINTDNILKVIGQEEIDSMEENSRVVFSSHVIEEIITGLHYTMYNGYAEQAITGLECLNKLLSRSFNAPIHMKITALLRSVQNSTVLSKDSALLRSPYYNNRRQTVQDNRRYAFSNTLSKSSAPLKETSPQAQGSPSKESHSDVTDGKQVAFGEGQKCVSQEHNEMKKSEQVLDLNIKISIDSYSHDKLSNHASLERMETAL